MLNLPLYELSDTLVLTGFDLTESREYLTYSYQEDASPVSQSYVYDPFTSNSYYSESYDYGSSNGATVDNVFSASRIEKFDSAGRLIERETSNTSNYIEFGSEYESTSSTISSYAHSNTSGYEIDYGTEIVTSSSNGVVRYISETTFEYSCS